MRVSGVGSGAAQLRRFSSQTRMVMDQAWLAGGAAAGRCPHDGSGRAAPASSRRPISTGIMDLRDHPSHSVGRLARSAAAWRVAAVADVYGWGGGADALDVVQHSPRSFQGPACLFFLLAAGP